MQLQVADWGEWFELERSMHNRQSVLAPAWVAELLNIESFLGIQRPANVHRWDTLPNPIPGLDDNLAPTAAETHIAQTQLQANLRVARAYFALPTGANPEFLKAYQTLQTKRDKARQRIVVGRVTPAQRAQARMRVAGVDHIDDMEVGKFVVTFYACQQKCRLELKVRALVLSWKSQANYSSGGEGTANRSGWPQKPELSPGCFRGS